METPFVPAPRSNPLTNWWPVLVGMLVFVALVSLSLSLIYVNRQQDVRQQAATPSTTMTLKWRGRTDSNKLVIDVLLNTKDFAVAGTELHGTIQGVKSGSVVISTSNPLGLQPVLTELVDQSGNATDFNITLFAPLSTSQPVNTKNADQVIASFTVSNVPSSGITVRFDGSTKVPAVSHPEATLEIGGSQTYTLSTPETSDASKKTCNQNCATDTECQSAFQCYKGQCRVKGDLEDASCKKIADNGLQRNCNQYCANGGECQSQYVCYFNQCRNPRNITNSNCAEPPSPTPKTTTATASKGSGVGGRVSVSPSPTPKPVIAKVTFVSPSPSATASARPSVSPTATISARASASQTLFSSPKVSPKPASPAPSTTSKSAGGTGRTVLAVIAILSGLALFGFSLYKLFKR